MYSGSSGRVRAEPKKVAFSDGSVRVEDPERLGHLGERRRGDLQVERVRIRLYEPENRREHRPVQLAMPRHVGDLEQALERGRIWAGAFGKLLRLRPASRGRFPRLGAEVRAASPRLGAYLCAAIRGRATRRHLIGRPPLLDDRLVGPRPHWTTAQAATLLDPCQPPVAPSRRRFVQRPFGRRRVGSPLRRGRRLRAAATQTCSCCRSRGPPDGTKGMAQTIADELGYEAHELANAEGRLSGPHPHPGARWKPLATFRRTPGGVARPDAGGIEDGRRARRALRFRTVAGLTARDRKEVHGARPSCRGCRSNRRDDRPAPARHDSATRGALRVDVETKAGPWRWSEPTCRTCRRGSSLQIRQLRQELSSHKGARRAGRRHESVGPPTGGADAGMAQSRERKDLACLAPSQPARSHPRARRRSRWSTQSVLEAFGSDHLAVRARLAIP